jgi:hypothetical protein
MLEDTLDSLRFFEWPHLVYVDFIILPPFIIDNLEVGSPSDIRFGTVKSYHSNVSFGTFKVDSGFLG